MFSLTTFYFSVKQSRLYHQSMWQSKIILAFHVKNYYSSRNNEHCHQLDIYPKPQSIFQNRPKAWKRLHHPWSYGPFITAIEGRSLTRRLYHYHLPPLSTPYYPKDFEFSVIYKDFNRLLTILDEIYHCICMPSNQSKLLQVRSSWISRCATADNIFILVCFIYLIPKNFQFFRFPCDSIIESGCWSKSPQNFMRKST